MNMQMKEGQREGAGKICQRQRWWTVMVPQTLHQTLIPSLRGGMPAMLMLAPQTHFTMFSMAVRSHRCFMN